jgi:hypothetical protein
MFFLFSCANVDIIRVQRNNSTESYQDVTQDKVIESKPASNLALLFFDKRYFNTGPVTKTTTTIKPESRINSADYRVIVDWMKDGVRHVKVQNIRTGAEYIVKEGDRSGTILLIDRTLFSYKFLINGVEVIIER